MEGGGGFKPPTSLYMYLLIPVPTLFLLPLASLCFFNCKILCNVYIIFPYFSHFPPPWESSFPPPLIPPPIHLPPLCPPPLCCSSLLWKLIINHANQTFHLISGGHSDLFPTLPFMPGGFNPTPGIPPGPGLLPRPRFDPFGPLPDINQMPGPSRRGRRPGRPGNFPPGFL